MIVDEHMQSSAPDVLCVGDMVEVKHIVTKELVHLPLANPANRQGRVAAGVIAGQQVENKFPGVLGTAICGEFSLIAMSV